MSHGSFRNFVSTCIFVLLASCVPLQGNDPTLLRITSQAVWVTLAKATNGQIWAVDLKSLSDNGGIVDAWAWPYSSAIGPDGATKYTTVSPGVHPMHFDCIENKYNQGIWGPAGGFGYYGWENALPDTVASVMLGKLCGYRLPSGYKIKWLLSASNDDLYLVQGITYAQVGSSRVIVFEAAKAPTVGTKIPQLTVFEKDVFSQHQIDCGNAPTLDAKPTQYRFSDSKYALGKTNEGFLSNWINISPRSPLDPIAERLCADNSIPVRAADDAVIGIGRGIEKAGSLSSPMSNEMALGLENEYGAQIESARIGATEFNAERQKAYAQKRMAQASLMPDIIKDYRENKIPMRSHPLLQGFMDSVDVPEKDRNIFVDDFLMDWGLYANMDDAARQKIYLDGRQRLLDANDSLEKTGKDREVLGYVRKSFEPESTKSQPVEDSMDAAKTKCTDLGFKQGTESFGKCVLKLSE